ncbi:hypothetical protein EVAR_30769_1 [Eumeta japonica]|uniref:ATP-dependent DNA helicase n=1 Tax=Eumeta variegata TaxID=151549 RepID=A0A4C1V707_EUMVA|nr:hypothetical protein EVAR_30769_1 [Eumeta japonica]
MFGGLNVLLFADLMQLPPVRGNQIFDHPARMVPATHLWRLFSFIELKDNMKQKGCDKKQKEAGRPGCLGGIDKKLAEKEERVRQRRLEEEKKVKQRELLAVAPTSSIDSLECLENSDEEQISNSELSTQIPCPEKSSERGKRKVS